MKTENRIKRERAFVPFRDVTLFGVFVHQGLIWIKTAPNRGHVLNANKTNIFQEDVPVEVPRALEVVM